jgi:hypothetical protein
MATKRTPARKKPRNRRAQDLTLINLTPIKRRLTLLEGRMNDMEKGYSIARLDIRKLARALDAIAARTSSIGNEDMPGDVL